ncbi:MAG TPA: transglycosylase SLT domain-containing protein [Candidatus Acidoferrales bacterium]|nr:transglycosylase SLT domain-containing protein [Candidatus Acidoferrales bacterium]
MTRASIVVVSAAIWLALSVASQAQIASYVDGNGKVVYVNADSPRRASGSTISSPPASGASPQSANAAGDHLDQIVQAAAERHNLDPALVKAVITTESGWNPSAISRKGAVGLMQLIPETAERFGVGNAFDPAQNVEGGTSYLKELLDHYNGDLTKSLAAYNAGQRAVDQSGGIPAYPETERYVQKVTDAYFRPNSGRDPSLWSKPKAPIRQETDSNGRIIFTNE